MRKKVRAIMNTIKRNHRGFSMIELITAIAILAILATAVVYVMNSSSKTYSELSVEAQLQSEAQLVANMITELAIDSSDALNVAVDTYNQNYDEAEGKILVLDSTLDSVKKQYVIGKKQGENKLYLAERTYDAANSTWGALTEALLGEYISAFTVDTSRVEKENVLMFTLSYTKNGRTYDGNYQVLMRNRAYADKEKEPEEPKTSSMLVLDISPKLVYIDIVNNQVPRYYVDELSNNGMRTVTDQGIPFSVTVRPSSDTNKGCNWALKNADTEKFDLSAKENAQTTYLTWKDTKSFKDSTIDTFTLVATKSMTLTDGETTIKANPKTAQILLRRVKKVSLFALSGATQWRSEFSDQYGGVSDSEAQGYAYVGTNGKYMPMNLSASISASNIAYGGGLTWKIYQKNASGTWGEVNNSSLVSLKETETLTSTTNVVNFGSAVENGQVFKVVATSVFDPSYEAEYVFGIAPTGNSDGDGFYSRGYYTDMGALLKEDNHLHSDMSPFSKLVFLKVTSVDGAGQNGLSGDKVNVVRDADGNWRLYLDFDAFAYSGEQKLSYYTGDVLVHITIGYYDTLGNLCIDGQKSGDYKAELEAQEGRKVSENYQNAEGKMVYCQMSNDIIYQPKKVKTTKVSPTNGIIVVGKGKTQSVSAKTSYYNILSPRNGLYYFGVYLNDMTNNLIESGKGSTNAYFEVGMTSSYGDTNKYVDTATISLKAKATSAQKKYLTEAMVLRLAANDFYLVTKTPHVDSYTEYKVLIANVEGTEAYIPGPKATGDFAWDATTASSVEAGTKTTVTGQNSAGDSVTAKVYKSGKKYYCVYGGKTYTYNLTYNFWAN